MNNNLIFGDITGTIRVAKELDYERHNVYELTIQVEDGGEQRSNSRENSDETIPGKGVRFDTASVTINVFDTNDNAPEFEHSPYTIRLLEENLLVNDGQYLENINKNPIFIASAKDADDPPYNTIEYSFRDGGRYNDYFRINGTTGHIFLSKSLDRERESKITVELLAMDSGSPRLTSTGTLNVIVEDVNDHEPKFESKEYKFSVEENVEIGTAIASIFAEDKDDRANSDVSYSVVGTDFFSIDKKNGTIKTMLELDREEIDSHSFKVVAIDSSEFYPLTGSAMVSINILDKNDNTPEVTNNNSDVHIPPGIKEGDFIMGISAMDRDTADNARLRFRLISGSDYFNINKTNGVITASSWFEERPSYNLQVEVSDQPLRNEDSLRTEVKMNVYLAEELVAPIFDDITANEVSIKEGIAINSKIAAVKAYGLEDDADIRYGISGGNTGMTFRVDPVTGYIITNNTVDFEITSKFELWIKTFYANKPLFSVSRKIEILVQDINDNAPIFEGSNSVKISVLEGTVPPFTIGYEPLTYDLDTGVNANINYELGDTGTNAFSVDSKTGIIKCHQELDRETVDRYMLRLVAIDEGSPRLSSTSTILITVTDSNDEVPRFTRLYSLNVTEGTQIGSELLTVNTVDLDTPMNSNVTYSFEEESNPDGIFKINQLSGKIVLVKSLDREVRIVHFLKL